MVVNSKGKLALVVTRKVGDGSFLPYTGEYQSSDSSLLRLLSPVNNRTKGASSSLVNITPPGIACRDPGAKCQETSALCNPVPSRTSRMTQKCALPLALPVHSKVPAGSAWLQPSTWTVLCAAVPRKQSRSPRASAYVKVPGSISRGLPFTDTCTPSASA